MTTLKLCGSQQTGKFVKRWEYQTILLASWEIYLQDKKQQLESDTEPWTSSKLGNEYIKAVYCHPACLTYMQSTSWEMSGWKTHKLESRFPGEISTTSDMLSWWLPLGFPGGWDGKEFTCSVGDLGSILGLGRSPGEEHGNPLQYVTNTYTKWEQWQIFFSWAPKSLLMMTAARKLKDACSLGEKLWQT